MGAKEIKSSLLVLVFALGLGGFVRADDFDDFRAKVQAKLPAGWACEPIQTRGGQGSFEIKNGENRFKVTIHRCDLLSQEGWNAKYRQLKDDRARIFKEKAFLRLGDKDWEFLMDIQRLPQGHYGNIGVRIALGLPEHAAYPDFQKDAAQIGRVCKGIQGLLVLYDPDEADSMLVEQFPSG